MLPILMNGNECASQKDVLWQNVTSNNVVHYELHCKFA